MTDWDVTQLRTQLTRHEEERLRLYRDTRGKWTIGVGRNLTDRGISRSESQFLLSNDITDVTTGLALAYPWFHDLDGPRQGAVINLGFNLGLGTFATFTTFLSLMATGNYESAAADLTGTAWYREVGQRGRDLVKQIQTGTWVNPPLSSSAMDTGTDIPHGGAA